MDKNSLPLLGVDALVSAVDGFFSGRFRGSLLSCVRALSGGVNDYGCVMLVHRHRLPPVSRSRLRLPPAHPVAGANVRLRPPRSPLAPSRLPLQPAVPLQPQAHRVLRMSPPQTRRKRRLAAETWHGVLGIASRRFLRVLVEPDKLAFYRVTRPLLASLLRSAAC